MVKEAFSHVCHWVFDLDNTLYHPSANLFGQIEAKMTEYVMSALNVTEAEADHLRGHYWRTHGTTLAGLMREHGLDPVPYLHAVHDISMDHLEEDADLAAQIRDLPGQKIVYTNGSAPYAARVLEARGLDGLFAAFNQVFAKAGVAPAKAAMFEDDPRNLAAPHAMGMRTVHVADGPHEADHIQHHTSDLTGFLRSLA